MTRRVGHRPVLLQARRPGSSPTGSESNPATCNQFRIRVPVQTRSIVAGLARDKDLGRANPGPGFRNDNVIRPGDCIVPPGAVRPASSGPYFSGCVDTRIRWGTAPGPHRALANFSADGQSSSCTGTMVGPRHVITAAHCVFLGGNWNDFTVIPARDGATWPVGSTQMSDTQGLNSGFRWYWIPAPLFDNPGLGYDTGLDIALLDHSQAAGRGNGLDGSSGAVRRHTRLHVPSGTSGTPGSPGTPSASTPPRWKGDSTATSTGATSATSRSLTQTDGVESPITPATIPRAIAVLDANPGSLFSVQETAVTCMTSATPFASSAAAPASPRSPSCRWPWASAPTPPSSACPGFCSHSRLRFRIPTI